MIKPPLYQGNDFKMVLGGIWFSAPRPTANRSSVLPDETEDRKLVFLRIYSRFDQSGSTRTFFQGSNSSTFFRKSGSRLRCGLHDFFFFLSIRLSVFLSVHYVVYWLRLLGNTCFLNSKHLQAPFKPWKHKLKFKHFQGFRATVTNPVLSGRVWTAQIVVSQIRHSNVTTTLNRLTW